MQHDKENQILFEATNQNINKIQQSKLQQQMQFQQQKSFTQAYNQRSKQILQEQSFNVNNNNSQQNILTSFNNNVNGFDQESSYNQNRTFLAEQLLVNLQDQENKKADPKIYDKLNQEANIFKENQKVLAEIINKEQMSECTFKPKTNVSNSREKRSSQKFLQDQQKFIKQKQDKNMMRKHYLEQQKSQEFTGKPMVNKNINDLLVKNKPTETVHERLFNKSKNKQSKVDSSQSILNTQQNITEMTEDCENNTFRPRINSKSASIVRQGKVQDNLYNDAMRRKEKQQNIQQQQESTFRQQSTVNKKYTSDKSEQMVASKFIKEFEVALNQIVGEEPEPAIDYMKLGEMMKKLKFLRNDDNSQYAIENPLLNNERGLLYDIYSILKGEELGGITRRNLCQFCLALIGVSSLNLNPDTSEIIPKQTHSSIQNISNSYSNQSLQQQQQNLSQFQNQQQQQQIQENYNEDDEDYNEDEYQRAANNLAKDDENEIQQQSNYNQQQQYIQNQTMQQQQQQQDDEFFVRLKQIKQKMNQKVFNIGEFDDNYNWILTEQESRQLQKTFDNLYCNRLNNHNKKDSYKTKNNKKTNNQPTYQPQINQTSRDLANQYREKLLEETASLIENKQINVQVPQNGKITHVDLLVYQKQAQKTSHQIIKQEMDEDEIRNCTFQPQISESISSNRHGLSRIESASQMYKNKGSFAGNDKQGVKKSIELYNQKKIASMKRDKLKQEIEYEKQCDECTFQPDIKKSQQNYQNLQNKSQISQQQSVQSVSIGLRNMGIKNVDKSIERVKLARERREIEKQMQNRGYNSMQGKKLLEENYQKAQQLHQVPFQNTQNNFQQQQTQQSMFDGQQYMQSQYSNYYQQDYLQQQQQQHQMVNQQYQDQNQIQEVQQEQLEENHHENYNRYEDQQEQQQQQNKNNNNDNNVWSEQKFEDVNKNDDQQQQNQINHFEQQQYQNDDNNHIQVEDQIQQQQVNNEDFQQQQELQELKQQEYREQQQQIQEQNQVQQTEQSQYQDQQESTLKSTSSKAPLLFVDVNLGPNKSERIIVYEGDTPEDLAEKFTKEHQLEIGMQYKLQELLESQISGLLHRIDEEEGCSDMEY